MNRSLAASAARMALRISRPFSPVSRRARASKPASMIWDELALLLGGEERHGADLVEVLTYGITHGISRNARHKAVIPTVVDPATFSTAGNVNNDPDSYPVPTGTMTSVTAR